MQEVLAIIHGKDESCFLPDEQDEIFPGVPWGNASAFFTPAFWAAQAWFHDRQGGQWAFTNYKMGETFQEEVVACLLGGHGITAEMSLAAFNHLKLKGAILGTPSEQEVSALLREPLHVKGRVIRYRFPNRRAHFIAEALKRLNGPGTFPMGGRELRDFLIEFPGIGPKTASWIVRNWYGSDDVAIIDIHIHRACLAAKLIPENLTPEKHYFQMEERFLQFANAIHSRASSLDNLVWSFMRSIGYLASA